MEIDRALTPYIDSLDWMPEKLTLEVSSPGIYRSLRSIEHFGLAVGELVCLSLNATGKKEVELKNKKLVGELFSYDNEGIEVDFEGSKLKLPYEYLKSANVEAKI